MAVAPGSSQSYRLPCHAPREHSQAPGGGSRQQLPEILGDCHFESLPLAQGLTLVRSRYHPNRPLIEEASSCHAGRLLVITCALQGTSGYLDAKGSSLAFRAGHTTVTAFQASRGERRYGANETVEQLRLLVGEALLQQYWGPPGPVSCWARTPCNCWPAGPLPGPVPAISVHWPNPWACNSHRRWSCISTP